MTQVNNKALKSLNTSMGAFSTSSKHTDDGSDNDFEQLKKVKKVDKKKVVLEVSEEEEEEEEESEEEESSSSDEEEPPKKAVVKEVKKTKEVKHIDHEIGIIPPKPQIPKYYSAIILYKHKYKKEHSKDAVLTDKEYDMMYNKLTPEEKEPYETQSKADKEKATGPYNAWKAVYGEAWVAQQKKKAEEEEEKKKILPPAAVVVAAVAAQKVTQPPDDLLNVMFRIFDERYQLKVSAPAVAAVAAPVAAPAKPRKRKAKTDTPVKKAKVESEVSEAEEEEEAEEKIFNKKSVNHFVAASF